MDVDFGEYGVKRIRALIDTCCEVFAVGKRSALPEGSLRPARRPLALSAVGSQPVPGGTEGAQVNISLPVCHYLGPLQCVCTDAWIYSADVTPELILGYPFLVAYGLTVDTVKHCVLPMQCIDVQPSRMICQRVQCVNGSVASVQVRKMKRESNEPFSDRSRGHQSDQGVCSHTSAQDTPPPMVRARVSRSAKLRSLDSLTRVLWATYRCRFRCSRSMGRCPRVDQQGQLVSMCMQHILQKFGLAVGVWCSWISHCQYQQGSMLSCSPGRALLRISVLTSRLASLILISEGTLVFFW